MTHPASSVRRAQLSVPKFPKPAILPCSSIGKLGQTQSLVVYSAGCDALQHFAQSIDAVTVKVGVSSRADVHLRINELAAEGYASILKRPQSNHISSLPRESNWRLLRVSEADLAGTKLPFGVNLRGGYIVVQVPKWISIHMFDAAVRAMLAPRSLNAFLDTGAGQARMRAAGYDPALRLHSARRGTVTDLKPAFSRAIECYLFMPRKELRILVEKLGQMIDGL